MSAWRTVRTQADKLASSKRKKLERVLYAESTSQLKESRNGRKRVASRNLAATLASKKKAAIEITPPAEGETAMVTNGVTAQESASSKSEKIPQIMVQNLTEHEFSSLCSATKKGELNASFSFAAGNYCRIACSSRKDYDAVKSILTSIKREFYSHEFPGDKPYQLVLKGLRFGSPETLSELLKENKLNPSHVREITVGESRSLSSKLFIVSFPKGTTTLEEVRKITHLNYTSVKWEKYKPRRSEVVQCSNCFQFGHGAMNCAMSPRCSKCGSKHETRQCAVDIQDKRVCANCSQNHSPMNKHCPARIAFLKRRNAQKLIVPPKPVLSLPRCRFHRLGIRLCPGSD